MKNTIMLCLALLSFMVFSAAKADDQLTCLAKAVYFESRGEPIIGQVAVAQTIINRSIDKRFPNNICEVVHQKHRNICAFSWYCDNYKIKNDETWIKILNLSEQILYNELKYEEFNNILWFHNKTIKPNWKKRKVKTIGNHVFYSD